MRRNPVPMTLIHHLGKHVLRLVPLMSDPDLVIDAYRPIVENGSLSAAEKVLRLHALVAEDLGELGDVLGGGEAFLEGHLEGAHVEGDLGGEDGVETVPVFVVVAVCPFKGEIVELEKVWDIFSQFLNASSELEIRI